MLKYAGPILILIFTGSQAFRDVYPGAAFRGVNFFLVMLMAWTCFFFSLKHQQPSYVNTLHSGMGPVFVFAMELADQRIGYSSAVFAGIVAYSIFAILANVSHARAVARLRL